MSKQYEVHEGPVNWKNGGGTDGLRRARCTCGRKDCTEKLRDKAVAILLHSGMPPMEVFDALGNNQVGPLSVLAFCIQSFKLHVLT